MNILAHKQSGIYEIYNTTNGHRYIGSAVYIGQRWKHHLQQLRTNKHHSVYLQRAFNLHGESAFVFRVLEECNVLDLISTEQKYLDAWKPEYNISQTAGSPLGVKHTAETKAKVGAASKGNKYALGLKHTDEWKQQNSERMKGNKHSLGVKQSDETKKKKSLANIGKHLGSKPWLGKTHAEETKEKIRLAQKGKPKSEEHKQKLREARRRFLDSLKGLFVE
jgi:group I intron endonuclease